MEKISNYINVLFQKLFEFDNHPFYTDIKRASEITKKHINLKKKFTKTEIKQDYNKNLPEPLNIKPTKSNNRFDINLVKELSDELNKSKNFKKILFIVNELYRQYIPVNFEYNGPLINNLTNFKNSERINIAILGSGPVGLFLACYLQKYYNSVTGLNDYPKVNILIFENRILKSKLRKPYTRTRNFAFNSSFFSYLFPKIFTWIEGESLDLFLSIYILEYVLFTRAYYDYNIPFIFDIFTWEEYLNIFKEGNFKVVFDCTGGRVEHDLFKNIDSSWIKKVINNSKMNIPKLLVNESENLVTIESPENKFLKNYYYGNLIVYIQEKDKSLTYFENFDLSIKSVSDLKLFLNINKKLYNLENTINIVKKVESTVDRNYLYTVLSNRIDNKEYIFQFELFNTYMRHAIKISEVVKYQNHKFLYIGAGDTIFHSHFITGSGLNRTISFAVKCANFISNIGLE